MAGIYENVRKEIASLSAILEKLGPVYAVVQLIEEKSPNSLMIYSSCVKREQRRDFRTSTLTEIRSLCLSKSGAIPKLVDPIGFIKREAKTNLEQLIALHERLLVLARLLRLGQNLNYEVPVEYQSIPSSYSYSLIRFESFHGPLDEHEMMLKNQLLTVDRLLSSILIATAHHLEQCSRIQHFADLMTQTI
ncbi:MAG: hypothetical protein EOP06_01245 [Proteobacteria bacterium]|nr:MAG: hypothetical protein EOP06_01245 [Pseudomonadota bacterium]